MLYWSFETFIDFLFRTAHTAFFACVSSSVTFCVCSPPAGFQRPDCPLGQVFPLDRLLLAYSCLWPSVCGGKLWDDEWGWDRLKSCLLFSSSLLILWFSAIKQKWDKTDLVTKIKCKPAKCNMFHFIALYLVSVLHNNMNLGATVQLLRHLLAKS